MPSTSRTASRLTPIPERALDPFVRATVVDDISIYWLPVDRFPMLPGTREWLQHFHQRLALFLKESAGLREECFLQFKSLYPDLLDRFTDTSQQYIPLPGASLVPGAAPPKPPDFDAVKKEVEEASKRGTPLDVKQWIPDHLYWFLMKHADRQRADFLGHGGMLTLYLAPDPKTAPPELKAPLLFRSMPCYSEDDSKQIQALYSMQDKFLAQSKEAFGEPFRGDSSYKGLVFILPLFTSATFDRAIVPAIRRDTDVLGLWGATEQ
jgi:hypothetical protein